MGTRAIELVLAGVLLFGLTVAGSALVAPDRSTVAIDDGSERATLVGSQGGGPGWHEHGSAYLLNGTDVEWREDSADSYFDVQRLSDGRVLAGFMDSGYEECGPYESPCAHTGIRLIDPDADGGAEVVEEYSFPVRSQSNSEIHDAEPLPDGGFAMTDMDHERIMIVEDGEVTWTWNASQLYDEPEDPTRTDWLHINDIDRIGEDRFLVSVRNANQLVIVERTDDGGARSSRSSTGTSRTPRTTPAPATANCATPTATATFAAAIPRSWTTSTTRSGSATARSSSPTPTTTASSNSTGPTTGTGRSRGSSGASTASRSTGPATPTAWRAATR
ncbi:hypothetical protein ACFQFH_11465 [Halobaculum halobium]|uniref:hypothetical protein n=1 Tax=Halobaculum halobium TaxID=3032281 RepID=UPI00360AE98A